MLRARASFVLMSEICSEKDWRSFLDGERDEFEGSTDISGEGRAGIKEKVFPPTLAKGG